MLWANLTCETSDANPPVECYQLLKNGEIWATSDNGTWIKEILEPGKHVFSCRALHFLGNVTSSDKAVTFDGGFNHKYMLLKAWRTLLLEVYISFH